ncbi:MAG: hypothetical protein K9M54_10920 [Kiritimatiellales bacterium]|nr:hypothetical protein [Kiritimatiellales bacterium]
MKWLLCVLFSAVLMQGASAQFVVKDNFDDAKDGSFFRGRKTSEGNAVWNERRLLTTLAAGQVVVTTNNQQAYIEKDDLTGKITMSAKVNLNHADLSGTLGGFYMAMTDDAESMLFGPSDSNILWIRLAGEGSENAGRIQMRLNDREKGILFTKFSEKDAIMNLDGIVLVTLVYDQDHLDMEGTVANLVTGETLSLSGRLTPKMAKPGVFNSYGFGVVGRESGTVFIDDFMLSCNNGHAAAAPAPQKPKQPKRVAKASPYRQWISGFGLTAANASTTADPDGDTFNNLYEYAFGGDPTNGTDHGMDPIYGDLDEEGSSFVYIYPRRKDAGDDLEYLLERNGVPAEKGDCEMMNTADLNDNYDAVIVRVSPEVKQSQDIKIKLVLHENQ